MWQSILAETAPTFWLPKGASTIAPSVDLLFNWIMWICIFFFFLVTILLVLFVVMFRHRPGVKRDVAAGHNTPLELTWTLVPSVIVVFLYYYGFREYMNMAIEPPNSYEIMATGQMWHWSFTYPNGHTDDELHVPINTPVRIVLQSQDVIHNLYIPAFRVKKDAVPGRYNRMWFEATDVGDYDVFCSAYCGTNHSTMRAKAVVQSPEEFKAWLAKALEQDNSGPPEAKGKRAYMRYGCVGCHTIDGSKLTGPSWKDLWGSTVNLTGGQTVLANEPYIIESIRVPGAKIVDGFSNVMPVLPVTDADIQNIIAFMKTISSHTSAADMPGATSAPATKPASPTTQPIGLLTSPTISY
jgi:cytochrome c oxidase subunit 2